MKKLMIFIGLGLMSSAFGMNEPDLEMGLKPEPVSSVVRKLDFGSPAATPVKPVRAGAIQREIDPESLEEILLYPEEDLQRSKVGKWWNSIGQKKKDAIELLGLLGVDLGVEAYRYFSGNDLLSMLVGYAVGKQAARVTDKYACWKKLLAGCVGWAVGTLPYALVRYDALTVNLACMMFIVHAIFDEYSKRTGRANTDIMDFRDMPLELQQIFITEI